MPTLKSSLIKRSKSMLFFHIWNANFSVTPINSQMYMTKPKQVKKKLSENTGKTFSIIMPPFTCKGWAYLRKLLYIQGWMESGILAFLIVVIASAATRSLAPRIRNGAATITPALATGALGELWTSRRHVTRSASTMGMIVKETSVAFGGALCPAAFPT